MGALIIDTARVQEILAYAKEHRIIVNQEVMDSGEYTIAGDHPEYVADFPIGWKIVYSEEYNKGHLVRHISISERDYLPNQSAAVEVLKAFGFKFEGKGTIFDLKQPVQVYPESDITGSGKENAINVQQAIIEDDGDNTHE